MEEAIKISLRDNCPLAAHSEPLQRASPYCLHCYFPANLPLTVNQNCVQLPEISWQLKLKKSHTKTQVNSGILRAAIKKILE